MNRPCIITIIGITRGKRVARRKTFNKWPFRISPIFFFFPFLSLSLSLSLSLPREVIPERKKEKNGRVNVRLFDCSIASPSYFIELMVAVPFSSHYHLFFNVFFFFWIPLRFFFRLIIKCFYKHNNSFFFFCYSWYREIENRYNFSYDKTFCI